MHGDINILVGDISAVRVFNTWYWMLNCPDHRGVSKQEEFFAFLRLRFTPEKTHMTRLLLTSIWVAALFLLFATFQARPAMADGLPMDITISGTGPGPGGYGGLDETLTGTFVFNPAAATISGLSFSGNDLVSNSGQTYSEFWVVGTVLGVANTSFDLFSVNAVGSQGDLVSIPIFIFADGSGGVDYSGSEIMGGAGGDIRIDEWVSSVLPDPAEVPEPPTFLLLGVGLIGISVLGFRKLI